MQKLDLKHETRHSTGLKVLTPKQIASKISNSSCTCKNKQ